MRFVSAFLTVVGFASAAFVFHRVFSSKPVEDVSPSGPPPFGPFPFPAGTGNSSWQWVPVNGTRCIRGEQTGVYVRYSTNGNKNLGVYLHGGGGCFNMLTCKFGTAMNPHPPDRGATGIFASRPDNPLDNWNWITVPYCTGDIHAGNADIDSKRFRHPHRFYHGHVNLKLVLERAQLTFTDVETLFVTGESAGGFGAFATYPTMRDYFPAARGVLMDDSGPILSDKYMHPCLQKEWRNLWNLNDALPEDCPCNNPAGNLWSAWDWGRVKYPKDSFSLISSLNDAVISEFFSFGLAGCHTPIPAGFHQMHEGLEALAATGVNTYMIPGKKHTHTSHDEFYSRVVQGVAMKDWIAQLIDPNQVDPETVRPTSEDLRLEEMTERLNSTRFDESITV